MHACVCGVGHVGRRVRVCERARVRACLRATRGAPGGTSRKWDACPLPMGSTMVDAYTPKGGRQCVWGRQILDRSLRLPPIHRTTAGRKGRLPTQAAAGLAEGSAHGEEQGSKAKRKRRRLARQMVNDGERA